MSDSDREHERSVREAAQRDAGDPVEGSARVVPAREIKQMLSVRMEPELIAGLREVAANQGVTVAELMREAAASLVEHASRQQVSIRFDPFSLGVPANPVRATVAYWDGESVRSRESLADVG
jgi:Ribbon-helix-helix protein, copG family